MKLPEKWKTYGDVFDEFTFKTLNTLEAQGSFSELTSSLSLGKEAHIFLAKKRDGSTVVIKVYRLMNNNFNKMFSYIKSDPRYENLKGRKRQIIFAWAQREYRNLVKAREAGVRVPSVYSVKNHIIVMEYIGDESEAAPQAKNAGFDDPKNFMDEVLKQMKILYTQAQLVHSDLSMFNILVHNQLPVLIDMSQTTMAFDHNAREYITRDCENVRTLAKRLGVTLDPDCFSFYDEPLEEGNE